MGQDGDRNFEAESDASGEKCEPETVVMTEYSIHTPNAKLLQLIWNGNGSDFEVFRITGSWLHGVYAECSLDWEATRKVFEGHLVGLDKRPESMR